MKRISEKIIKKNETLQYYTQRHWYYVLNPLTIFYSLIFLGIPLIVRIIKYMNYELALTNRRIIIAKMGWLGMEYSEKKHVEAINLSIRTSTLGKYLGYRTIVITKPGGEEILYEKMKYPTKLNEEIEIEKKTTVKEINTVENKKIDFIAIDFETANKNRISACAIGICIVSNSEIISSKRILINPPGEEVFSSFNTSIHGIRKIDVASADCFKTIWDNELKELFNNKLIVFHNASMDSAVLKQSFEFYNIQDFDFKVVDTMQLAGALALPKKIKELSAHFGIEFENTHDPVEDAKVCAKVFIEIKKIFQSSAFEKELKYKVKISKKESDVLGENEDYLIEYGISEIECQNLEIENSAFLFTGDLKIDRDIAKDLILCKNGIIKSGVTSKVDYVVVGKDYGWAKIQKLHKYNTEKNCNIKIITEKQFLNLIDRI
ncbi:hypothetical protein LNJ03_11190 [Tenacibaculum dicentrarchi]|nr:hypothetical protein [Tenacibaculum dicentrarchi]